jgi:arylsulfate sulfotransferase
MYSCGKDKTPENPNATSIRSIIDDGTSLMLEVENDGRQVTLTFETRTLSIPADEVRKIDVNKAGWKTTLTFSDGTFVVIPTLPESFEVREVVLDPTGYAPLSARITASFMAEGKLKMRILSKDAEIPDITYEFSRYGYNHEIDIHGLYPGHLNTVYITYADKNGKDRLTDVVEIQTEDISDLIDTEVKSVKVDASKMEPGLFMPAYIGKSGLDTHHPYMIDGKGNTRWALDLTRHKDPDMSKLISGNGFKRMKNGNFIAGGRDNRKLFEINMVGEMIRSWDLEPLGVGFHHDIIEMPNGNFLFTATKFPDTKPDGSPARMDYVVELDRETGAIVTAWDLKESLDVDRDLLRIDQAANNWAHGNGVIYIEDEDAIIVSTRFQGFAKLDRKNNVKWILSPQKGWKTQLRKYLLNPLDAGGNPITDESILSGDVDGADFEWNWTSHAPRIMPDGNFLFFDNGYMRNFIRNRYDGYSRAVIYRIDEEKMTVQQVWQYGKERGDDCYAYAGGAVQYLPQTGNIMFGPGMEVDTSIGRGGRFVEVVPQTGEVVCEIEIVSPYPEPFQCAAHVPLYPVRSE